MSEPILAAVVTGDGLVPSPPLDDESINRQQRAIKAAFDDALRQRDCVSAFDEIESERGFMRELRGMYLRASGN